MISYGCCGSWNGLCLWVTLPNLAGIAGSLRWYNRLIENDKWQGHWSDPAKNHLKTDFWIRNYVIQKHSKTVCRVNLRIWSLGSMIVLSSLWNGCCRDYIAYGVPVSSCSYDLLFRFHKHVSMSPRLFQQFCSILRFLFGISFLFPSAPSHMLVASSWCVQEPMSRIPQASAS